MTLVVGGGVVVRLTIRYIDVEFKFETYGASYSIFVEHNVTKKTYDVDRMNSKVVATLLFTFMLEYDSNCW